MSIIDGGPAFPTYESNVEGHLYCSGAGMSLRDYFAGQALLCIAEFAKLGLHDMQGFPHKTAEAKVAADAYRLADAMLVERAAKSNR